MRTWTVWDWRSEPCAPLLWPDPERRIVLCEPGLFDSPTSDAHCASVQLCRGLARGALAVVPCDATGLRRVEYEGIIPALLVRRFDDFEDIDCLRRVKAKHRALLLEPEEALELECWMVSGIDLVIVRGREKPLLPAWVRGIRDQCQAGGVAFVFLGWGAWSPDATMRSLCSYEDMALFNKSEGGDAPVYLADLEEDRRENWAEWHNADDVFMYRVGPERSGRMLDGREWLEVPEGI